MDYRDLKVWQKAHAITLAVYQASKSWPADERFGLTSQARRAAVSIEANLAEGQSRYGSAEFARFVRLSAGSAAELDCELLIARDLGYLAPDAYAQLAGDISEVRAMLTALASRLASSA